MPAEGGHGGVNMGNEKAREVAGHFLNGEELLSVEPFGNGHINDTFLLVVRSEDGVEEKRVLQRINRKVFSRPDEVMENIAGVTAHLHRKIEENGGDPLRETLNIVPAKEGALFYQDAEGEYWRVLLYITDGVCYEETDDPELFGRSGYAFGNFQRFLADYPADTLHETIPGFHDTKARLRRFQELVLKDPVGRVSSVREEIDFVLGREDMIRKAGEMMDAGELPLRVTHNDTKLNNIMMDKGTGRGLCVMDLDTVMPGFTMYDFGDSIRFGASTAAEDERDLGKVSCDMRMFAAYTKGFIEGCGGSLTKKEIQTLPLGAKLITLEQGIRFLADYLEGDVYYKIHREGQNLDRARTQLRLVADMEKKWDEMNAIVGELLP